MSNARLPFLKVETKPLLTFTRRLATDDLTASGKQASHSAASVLVVTHGAQSDAAAQLVGRLLRRALCSPSRCLTSLSLLTPCLHLLSEAVASFTAQPVLTGSKGQGHSFLSRRCTASSNLDARSFQWSRSTRADAEKMFGLRVVSASCGPM